jgi:hypothetical protein
MLTLGSVEYTTSDISAVRYLRKDRAIPRFAFDHVSRHKLPKRYRPYKENEKLSLFGGGGEVEKDIGQKERGLASFGEILLLNRTVSAMIYAQNPKQKLIL